MKNEIDKIIHVVKSQSGGLDKNLFFLDKKKLDKNLFHFFSFEFSIQYILSPNGSEFLYLSSGFKEFFKINNLTAFKPDDYLRRIHPDDIEHVEKCNEFVDAYLFKYIDEYKVFYYKITYQLRIKDKNGQYKLMLYQGVPLAINENKKIANFFVSLIDIECITVEKNNNMSFVGFQGMKSFFNVMSNEDVHEQETRVGKITVREIEVLKFLMQGYTSKEIALVLHISPDTVRTHRNNVLKKTKLKTITQVISYYIKKGIL